MFPHNREGKIHTPVQLKDWIEVVVGHMPHLSKPTGTVLALWSFGMVLARSCGLTSVSVSLASLLGKKEDALRQRLREWCWDAQDKKGQRRQALDVTACFDPLLRWILALWSAQERRLALVMDATTLGQRFVVLAISVVYRGCGIPIAWVVLPAIAKGAWKDHWLTLFEHLRSSVPADWTVIVLADRGLYANWLYQHIQSLGWHPYLRINSGGKFRPEGANQFYLLSSLVSHPGCAWSGRVVCFKSQPVPGTLLACWAEGCAEPWLILTDLAPEQAEACWYGLRPWIECYFKDAKRGGWQWHQTKMTDPERATRLWLAIAVATLWTVSVGGEAEANLPASSLDELPETHIARRRATKRSQPRLLSCFRRGWLVILSALVTGLLVPLGHFYPEPWPCSTKTYP